MVLRTVVATSLTAIAIPVLGGGTASAAGGQWICNGFDPPPGYIITKQRWHSSCTFSSTHRNQNFIEQPNPSGVWICFESPIPPGYVVDKQRWSDNCQFNAGARNQYHIKVL